MEGRGSPENNAIIFASNQNESKGLETGAKYKA